MGQQFSTNLNNNPDADADIGTGAVPIRSKSTSKLKRLTGRPKPSPLPTSTPPPASHPETPKPKQSLYPEKWNILNLPLELRNQIYSYILNFPPPLVIYRVSSSPIVKTDVVSPPYPSRLDQKLAPLFLTNKQISYEARTYFYSHNVFSVPNPTIWPANWARLPLMRRWFIDRIGIRNSFALRHLKLVFPLDAWNYVQWEKSAARWDVSSLDGTRRSLFPGLASVCPNLTVLEFEPRSSSIFLNYLVGCLPDARGRTLRTISQELRAEFPVLKELIINFFEPQDHWHRGGCPLEEGETSIGPAVGEILDVIPVELGIEELEAGEVRLRGLGWTEIRSVGPDDGVVYREVGWWGLDEIGETKRAEGGNTVAQPIGW